MKIIIFLMLTFFLNAVEYTTVFEEPIKLDLVTPAIVKLQIEKSKELLESPAKVILEYGNISSKEPYVFIDKSRRFPILYFDGLSLNTQINKRVSLLNKINIFDIDGDGKNEIFIYGTSHYGGSGIVGKLIVLTYDENETIRKIGLIEATDNYDMQYIASENIIIVAQYIWRSGLEGHYGDSHKYQFYIYEGNELFNKLPILLTSKKYNDEKNTFIIEDNLDAILEKYKVYKNYKISKDETARWTSFVHKYWQKIAQKDFAYLNNIFANKVYYYNNILNRNSILRDKENILKTMQKINFNLTDFLVYKKDNIITIEYIKTYDIDDGKDYGKVKSIMKIKNIEQNYKIIYECDEVILSLKKDLD